MRAVIKALLTFAGYKSGSQLIQTDNFNAPPQLRGVGHLEPGDNFTDISFDQPQYPGAISARQITPPPKKVGNRTSEISAQEQPITVEELYERVVAQSLAENGDKSVLYVGRYYYPIPNFECDRNKLREQIRIAEKEIKDNPASSEAFYKKGKARFQLFLGGYGIADSAYKTMQQFEEKGITVEGGYGALESMIIRKGDAKPIYASHDLEKALELGSRNPDAYFQTGLINLFLKKRKSAHHYFGQTIEAAGKEFTPWHHHFHALTSDKKEERVKGFTEEVSHNPNSDSYLQLGLIHLRDKKYPKALEYLGEAERIAPNTKMLNLHIGRAYLEQGELDRSLEYFTREIDASYNNKDPYSRHEAYKDIGLVYLNHKDDPEKASEYFDKLIEEADYRQARHPKRYRYFGLSLVAHAQKHQKETPPNLVEAQKLTLEAEHNFLKATEYGHEYEDHVRLAHTRLSGKGFDIAMKEIEEKLQEPSNYSNPQIKVARDQDLIFQKTFLLLESGQTKEAKDLLEAQPQSEPGPHSKLQQTLAEAIEKKSQGNEARDTGEVPSTVVRREETKPLQAAKEAALAV